MKVNDAWKYILPRGNVRKIYVDYQLEELNWKIRLLREIIKKLKGKGGGRISDGISA